MNTSTSPDARSLAHRLTTVGHALHHRLFTQLRDSELHPKTVMILSAIDGRIDAPWVRDRLARGGKRVDALAERGWIERGDDGWRLTDGGREILDRVDAARAALLADVPAEQLERLTTALDALSDALGVDATEASPERGFRGPGRGGFGPGFGPGPRGFGARFGRGSGHGDHETDHGGHRGHAADRPCAGDERTRGGRGFGRDGHGHGHHRGHQAAQHAFERGFDAGFRRGRESSASE